MPLFVARHAARVDYAERDAGNNWTAKAERPWDPPLTAEGTRQGLALGAGCAAAAQRLEVPPVTRVVSSPFVRAIQTAAAAARALGVSEVAVEPGMAEIMSDKWFGHWAVAGADSTWGGPQTKGPQPARPEAATPAGGLIADPAVHAGATLGADVAISAQPPAVAFEELSYIEASPETYDLMRPRVERTLRALAERWPGESVLVISHGSTCMQAYELCTGETFKGGDRGATGGGGVGLTALSVLEAPGPARPTRKARLAMDSSHLSFLNLLATPGSEAANDNNEASERALAALRAKGQLLELETEARQRMSAQLAEVTSAHAAEAEAAKADLQKERSARVALAAALKAAEEEATALRGSSRESSSSLARLAKELDAVQTNQFALEAQNQALIKQLSELRLGEMRSQKAMRTMRELVMKVGEEDTAAMRQNLDEQARQTDRDIQLQRIEHMLKAATPDDVKEVVGEYKTELSRQTSPDIATKANRSSLTRARAPASRYHRRGRRGWDRRRLPARRPPRHLTPRLAALRDRTWPSSCTRSPRRRRRA